MLVEVLEVIEDATSVEEYKNGLCLPKKGRARVRVINEDREMVVSFLNSEAIFAVGTIGYLIQEKDYCTLSINPPRNYIWLLTIVVICAILIFG